ncbi:RNA ligase [Mycobacteroides abscessus subsp. massiliense]|uniref:RNA ligase family protein n=1 Tax=Mycobacteroides abscessus TaxID=36809 RepID=UPI000925B065|nr:RNA ligase family protein [Mycobacteroides abscessus]SHX44169.1 RNA ligase [Mycobacteroides abscessus subsp. abscessus]SKM67060.1 RNA ligase [Mycobacteroides abscessus subsp. massiliense]SKN33534.1 RNA ligase [Mycobacteroides abscessus subsp. massiliense]SKP15398.1 RNA ligase [Mycobacteroides abscessus subsp. massiliense]SKP58567.1 RNA ligase [Mycobacteroides abscessus subsp. massiliense]
MASIEPPVNANYAATIVQIPEPLSVVGLDNLVAVPLFGYQALTQKTGATAGDLKVLFTAETQLDAEYARENNLFREATLNRDANETGYLETNARVRAIRLRKNTSNALLMPLESLAYTGIDVRTLKVGDTFDKLNGRTICRKYEVPTKPGAGPRTTPKIRQRVDQKLFPMHLDTEHLFRNLQAFREPKHVIVTQKLHGTSWRGGRVPALREKSWLERVVVNKWLRIPTPETKYEDVFGSRRVIKGRSDNNHYYDSDVWTEFGKTIEGRIPENFMVYGELVGWTDTQSPIQKGYTYNVKPGDVELYVYRVATVNGQGVIADLSWQGVKDFAAAIGVKVAPTLWEGQIISRDKVDDEDLIEMYTDMYLDQNFAALHTSAEFGLAYPDAPVPLSNPTSVDEGVCVRVEGQVPRIYKAKSPLFLEHETKALDKGELDMEAAA